MERYRKKNRAGLLRNGYHSPAPTPKEGTNVPSAPGKPAGKKAKPPQRQTAKPSRARDPLWDAVCSVTGSDPKASARFIGSVVKALRSADPPYAPAEVLALPAILAASGFTYPVTLGVVEKHIGRTRDRPGANGHQPKDYARQTAELRATYGPTKGDQA
jgi:hypothetical protein